MVSLDLGKVIPGEVGVLFIIVEARHALPLKSNWPSSTLLSNSLL
jgi:hypothetical protein